MQQITYHRLIQRDIYSALDYYDREGGSKLGDRFFLEVESVMRAIEGNPRGHHFQMGIYAVFR